MKRSGVFSPFLLILGCFCLLALPAFAQPPADTGEEATDEDLGGVWKPSEGVLYTTPEDQEGVLAALGAEQTDAETWTAGTYAVDGTTAVATFRVELVDAAALPFFLSPGDPIPCPHPNYRIYRNSVCGLTFLGWSGLCQGTAGGTSQRTSYNSYRTCRRQSGGGYCVNVRSIVGWTLSYDSSDCSGPLTNMVSHYGWACR